MQQSSISPGRLNTAGVDRNQGKHWLVYAGTTIAAGQLVMPSSTTSNAPSVTLADGDSALTTRTPIWIAVHGATSGQPLRVAEVFVLNNQNTSGAVAVGDAVYLSDTGGGWSHTPGTAKRRVGIILSISATTGSVLLTPADYGVYPVDIAGSTSNSTAIDGTQEAATSFDRTRTVKGGRLRAGSQIRIRALGSHTATTGAETHDMSLLLGSEVLATKASIDPANNDVFMFDFLVQVRSVGASGTIAGMGIMAFGPSGTANPVVVRKAQATIDTTADLVVAVQIDRQAAATDGDSARLEILSVDIID